MRLIPKNLKEWAKRLQAETYALYLSYGDPRVPWYAKAFTVLVVGLAFSPIDIIPDFIPVLGYLDDAIVVPLGVALAVKMIPKDVLAENREKAQQMVERGEKPVSRTAAALIIALWILLFVGTALYVGQRFFV